MKKGVVNLLILASLFLLGFIAIVCADTGSGISDNTNKFLDEWNVNQAISYMKNLNKFETDGGTIASSDSVKDSKSLWGTFVNPGTYPSFGDTPEAQKKEAQKRIWDGLSPEERKKFLMTVMEKKGLKLDSIRLNGLDSKDLTWEGSKLKTKDGAYLDFNELPKSWLTEIDYRDGKLTCNFDTQRTGDKTKERVLLLQSGTIDKEGNLIVGEVTQYPTEKINVLYGEGGRIEIGKVNGGFAEKNTDFDIKILDGANLKVGDDFYKQFYGKNSPYDAYRPKDENGNIIDEEAVVNIRKAGDSPSNFLFIPKVKNTIVSVVEDGKLQGEVYSSRREGINIFHNPQSYNPIPYEKEEPYVKIIFNKDKKLDLSIVSNDYTGFITQPEVNINEMVLRGTGGINPSDSLGKYIYVKNGDFGITVDGQKTYVSGKASAVASADVIANANSADTINVEGAQANTKIFVKGRDNSVRVTYSNTDLVSEKIWEEGVLLSTGRIPSTESRIVKLVGSRVR